MFICPHRAKWNLRTKTCRIINPNFPWSCQNQVCNFEKKMHRETNDHNLKIWSIVHKKHTANLNLIWPYSWQIKSGGVTKLWYFPRRGNCHIGKLGDWMKQEVLHNGAIALFRHVHFVNGFYDTQNKIKDVVHLKTNWVYPKFCWRRAK